MLATPALSYICRDICCFKLCASAECPVVNMDVLTVAWECNLSNQSLLECTVCNAKSLSAACSKCELCDRCLVECFLTNVCYSGRNYNLTCKVRELTCEGTDSCYALFNDELLNSLQGIWSAADRSS